LNRIIISSANKSEIEWLSNELLGFGSIVRTMNNLDLLIPTWDLTEANIIIVVDSVVESDEKLLSLVEQIMNKQTSTIVIFVHSRNESDHAWIANLQQKGVHCISFMSIEPGFVLQALRRITNDPDDHDLQIPVAIKAAEIEYAATSLDQSIQEIHDELMQESISPEDVNLKRQIWGIIAPILEQKHSEDAFDENDKKSIASYIVNQLDSTFMLEQTEKKVKEKPQKNPDSQISNRKDQDNPFEDDLDIELPLFKEKFLLKETIVGSILIAVIGVEPCAGVTHTTLLISNYLVRKGYKVAVIEASNKQDFAALEYAYEGMKGYVNRERSFSIEGIDYYKSGGHLDLSDFKNYDYIVLDLGNYQESEYLQEFKRAHVQIVVGHGSEWRQKHIYAFAKDQEQIDQSHFIYCIPFVDKIVRNDIRKSLPEGKVCIIPAHADPYQVQKDTELVLDEILQNVLGQRRSRSKHGSLYTIIVIFMLVIALLIFLLVRK
jgi:6-pyruvoyl-tetrahydropterin synthase